jgi:hypothetical protein
MSDADLKPEEILKITNSLAQGNKIAAIKIYREATGKGLKESKQFIDQLIPGLIEQDPERFAALTGSGAGCANTILFTLWFIAELFLG